ncbi:uncharacterized protein LOC123807925 [Phyllostomus hastatus]|uniref:uncharacterized protein LOC123807925 n=1 Tax=Phyllostomus hastatus TaxID=9423 RepID=UPI001E67F43C|nr:uncharacterized protein LOC123807925 [Phyllostomus hastatus]
MGETALGAGESRSRDPPGAHQRCRVGGTLSPSRHHHHRHPSSGRCLLVRTDDCLQVRCPGSLQAGPLPPAPCPLTSQEEVSQRPAGEGLRLLCFQPRSRGPRVRPGSPVLSPSLHSAHCGQLLGTAGVALVDAGDVPARTGRDSRGGGLAPGCQRNGTLESALSDLSSLLPATLLPLPFSHTYPVGAFFVPEPGNVPAPAPDLRTSPRCQLRGWGRREAPSGRAVAHRVRWQETSGTTTRVTGATGPGGGDQQAKLSPCTASHWPSLPHPPPPTRKAAPCFLLLHVSGAVVAAAGGPPCAPRLQGRPTSSPSLTCPLAWQPSPRSGILFFLGTGLWAVPRLEWTLGVRLGRRCAWAPRVVLTRSRSPEALGWLNE